MIKHVSCITKTLWLFKVRKHISGSPTLSKSLCGRSPVAVIELSYSIGKRTEIVLLSRCMDWVNAFKTWSAPAIILIACLSEVMKVLTFPFVFLAPLYKYLPSIRTSSTISWITWSLGSHVCILLGWYSWQQRFWPIKFGTESPCLFHMAMVQIICPMSCGKCLCKHVVSRDGVLERPTCCFEGASSSSQS